MTKYAYIIFSFCVIRFMFRHPIISLRSGFMGARMFIHSLGG
ncbi:hypothetical protein ES704_03946 [subsurface metagenome]|jgi:hypothetical protein